MHRLTWVAMGACLAAPIGIVCAHGIDPPPPAEAALYLFDQTFPNRIWEVDVTRPSVRNPLTTGISIAAPEFELFNGQFFVSTSTSENLYRLDGTTGALLQTIALDFPFGGNVITAMEAVDGELLGAFTTVGGSTPPRLVSIDTTTGVVDDIGLLQNISDPVSGMAYRNGILYAVNSRAGGPASLFTVNPVNGISVNLGLITEQFTGAGVTLTGLEFGLDGVLYGLGRGTTNDSVLYAIDPATRIAHRIGVMNGLLNATALTSGVVPAPGGTAMAGVAGAWAVSRRRRP